MKINLITWLFVIVVGCYSCSQKENTGSTQTAPIGWAEMDSFHTIQSEAYYPYKDSANLEPVKRLAELMAKKAQIWTSSSVLHKFNNDELQRQLNQFNANTYAFSEMIKDGASDQEIGVSLQSLHDRFHSIMKTVHEERQEQNHQHQ